MSDIWYHGAEDKTVGPLSLTDLKDILAREFDARNLLVWRAGFEQWQKAETVPELAICVNKPPPLPPSVPSSELRLAPDQVLQTGNRSSSLKRRPLAASIASAVVIAMIVGGMRFLAHPSPTTAKLDSASIISGEDRASFVTGGLRTCRQKQESDPENTLSNERVSNYCSCYMNALADTVTYRELMSSSTNSLSPDMQKKAERASASCVDQFQRSLMGGGR
jgi:hypothetical protein